MKIAVLYSGFVRTWNQCRINQQNNFFTPETDLFFYTYEKPENTECKIFVKIPEMYYPQMTDHPYESNRCFYSSIDSTLNQWRNQFVAFCMIPTGYDVYVKSRCDIELAGKIDFSQYDINDTNIYIPEGQDYYAGVNDQFAFGSYEVMKKYTSVYLNHQNIFQSGLEFQTESYVTANLKNLGVNIIRLPFTNSILR